MKIHRIISRYHQSNTYLLESDGDEIVIIDPGDPNIDVVVEFLEKNNKRINSVLITHEHADHCAGVNPLAAKFSFDLICSAVCGINIANSKQNFSFYIDIIDPFEINKTSTSVNDYENMEIMGEKFQFLLTPGHSPGSLCIFINNSLFTGDSLLNNLKTPLTFPHSNRADFKKSMYKLNEKLKPGMMIYPGHGEPFVFQSQNHMKTT